MSLKRTVLPGLRAPGLRGLLEAAWEKSSAREAELGLVRVAAVEGPEKPWNWDVRSSSCFCSEGSDSSIEEAALESIRSASLVLFCHSLFGTASEGGAQARLVPPSAPLGW